MGQKITASFYAGALIRRQIRNELKKLQFQGYEFEWMENKHFLDSDFILKGEETLVHSIVNSMIRWVNGN